MTSNRNMRCAISLLLLAATVKASTHCEQTWDDIKAPHIANDAYAIHLMKINSSDEYSTYMPNTKYQVILKGNEDAHEFIRFFLTVENENKTLSRGELEVFDPEVSEFSQECSELIVQVSQSLKTDISAYWTSPEEGSGCVIFRASVMESTLRWYMDGTLEQKFCQDPKASIDDPGPAQPKCCACDEAKYELTFEGMWSRYTHPKNFPTKPWSARFSDVIGASHTYGYRFWEFSDYASEGLKQVAENGLTRFLESELKNKSEHIRTIIKARGINFPNVTSKTFAVFRVDQQHHLMSVVSMIDPSPDWFVGVTGLELCLSNCSWVEHKELNLYPIDAGTDDGATYESADAKTQPQDVIRRITTTWPEDERSPFYDSTAIDMNPLARLYLKRQRIYEKDCERSATDENAEDVHTYGDDGCAEERAIAVAAKHIEACKVTDWGDWESCSVTCGRGVKLRQRKYKNEKAAAKHNCEERLTDRVVCYAEGNIECPPDEVDEKKCQLSPWGEWTACTRTCGPESRTRQRNFRPKKKRKECKHLYPHIELQQTFDCENPACESGEGGDGSSPSGEEETVSEQEDVTTDDAAVTEGDEDATTTEPSSTEEPLETETSAREVTRARKRRRKKCKKDDYTQWSFWTPCSVSCGTGTKSRSRQLKPELNSSPDVDTSGLYDCQYETTTCEAETKSCEITKELMEVICSQPEQVGHCPDENNDNSLRYYYDNSKGKCVVFHYTGCNGNMNNFRTLQECQATCGNYQDNSNLRNYKVKLSSIITYNVPLTEEHYKIKREKCDDEEKPPEPKKKKKKHRGETRTNALYDDKVDCRVSEWSNWSPCYSCRGHRTMTRRILTNPRNGGKSCPSKLIRRQKCHKVLPECNVQNDSNEEDENLDSVEQVSVHCRVSPWSTWSACSPKCGPSHRRRTRIVAIAPRGPQAQPCPPLVQLVDCLMPPC